jgi:phage-related protein
MIYLNIEYKVRFFKDSKGKSPVLEYINNLSDKERAKVSKYINFLKVNGGVLDEPYSKHIKGKIRELRVDFGKNRHRIFYFTFVEKNIIFLHAFLKKTAKTPPEEIEKAENNYYDIINNYKTYE